MYKETFAVDEYLWNTMVVCKYVLQSTNISAVRFLVITSIRRYCDWFHEFVGWLLGWLVGSFVVISQRLQVWFLAHSKNELMQWRGVRRLSVCPSICKLLRKSLLLARKWPDRHQTCTRWSPGKHASRLCSRSKVKGHMIRAFSWILGMSYSVIDGLVMKFGTQVQRLRQISLVPFERSRSKLCVRTALLKILKS